MCTGISVYIFLAVKIKINKKEEKEKKEKKTIRTNDNRKRSSATSQNPICKYMLLKQNSPQQILFHFAL